jgi:hypothetical protein
VRFVAEVVVSTPRRGAAPAHAGAHAFIVQRPWVPTAVLVRLADPADPTPYWVVGSRRPAELAAAVLAARDA